MIGILGEFGIRTGKHDRISDMKEYGHTDKRFYERLHYEDQCNEAVSMQSRWYKRWYKITIPVPNY